jgi:cobalt-zinc-cadmium efflux system membrane fusion protein
MQSNPRKTALALIPAIAVGILASCSAQDESVPKTPLPAAAVQPPSELSSAHAATKVIPIQVRPLSVTLHATGRILPDVGKEVNVASRFPGRVQEVRVALGHTVNRGDVIAVVMSQEISDLEAEMLEAKSKVSISEAQEERERQVYEEQIQRPKALISARTAYQETKVQMELAESEYQRQEGLYREKISSAKDYLSAKASLAKAKTAYAQASSDLQREERLFKNQALMKKDYQLAQAETLRAKQHLNTLQQRLIFLGMAPSMVQEVLRTGKIAGSINVVAPVSGIVSNQSIAPGEVVEPGKRMVTITDLAVVVACADIAEADLPKVRIGSPVEVTTSSYPNEKFMGTISFVSENVNPETRTISIRARLKNPLRHLKNNMYAEIDVSARDQVVLACPKSAIQEHDGKKVVYVQTAAGYEERPIEFTSQSEDYVAVTHGLKEGENVATQGSLLLKSELTYQH